MAAPTLSAQITPTGITAPSYNEILTSLQASFRGIYGVDSYLDPDSQDGQMLAVFAQAINDANAATIAVYNSFAPGFAVGAGLAMLVKINGLQKQAGSNSTVDQQVVGVAGTEITNGVVQDPLDTSGNQWALPPLVVIPPGGSTTITATSTQAGAIKANAGTITKIVNPTAGWQTTTNTSDATPGAPVESDAALRVRQSISTSLPAQTPLESIVAAVENLPGVQTVQPYENDTGTPDGNGIPGHSIALVVVGGDDTAVATAIADGKLGTGTYGSTSITVIDSNGVPDVIHFSRPTLERLIASVTITPLQGYASSTGTLIQLAMQAWVAGGQIINPATGLPLTDSAGEALSFPGVRIGGSVNLNDLVAAAKLPGSLGQQYKIEYGALIIALFGNPLGTADVPMAWNQEAGLAVADITLVVL